VTQVSALWIVGIHLLVATIAAGATRRLGAKAFLVAALAPAATLVWLVGIASSVLDDGPLSGTLAWAPSLGFELEWRVDAFALVMVGLIAAIGLGVFAFSSVYFSRRGGLARLVCLLVLFAGAMTGLVLSDNLFALFLFWELTSVTSYLLIGTDDERGAARSAALRALLTTGAGGLALLAGFVILGQQAGTPTISEILAAAPTGTLAEVALVLVLLGAFTKSAQFPFHFWLPGAMAAPTPISAYLHSATMVKAGIYLVARLAPAFGDAGVWRPLVLAVGGATMLVGGVNALRQTDLKLLLAHGTVSQLGFLMMLFGAGLEEATLAGVAVLVAHALFKAALFLVVGAIDKRAGTRDLRRLDRVWRSAPVLTAVGVIAAASMAGVPPLVGFVAKELALESLLHAHDGWAVVVLAVVVLGSVLTAAYSLRFVIGAFGPRPRRLPAEDVVTTVPQGAALLLVPSLVLAAATLVAGVAPRIVERLVVDGARGLDPSIGHPHLALWHGINTALLLSVLALTAGVLAWWAASAVVDRPGARVPRPLGANLFDLAIRILLRGAESVTGRIQTGSLPLYMFVTLATVLTIPIVPLLGSAGGWFDEAELIDRPLHVVVALGIVVATFAATRARSRLGGAIVVGSIGYGVAGMFVLHGAPDLALTQVLVETLLLVVFVLVLRHLPAEFDMLGTAIGHVPRIVVSVASGLVVGVLTFVAASSRVDRPLADGILQRALPDAGGSNAVNVLLVDFRAFDTFGESTVVTVAALGIIGLVRAARRDRQRSHDTSPVHRFRPSPLLDSAIRVLFHTLLLLSVVFLAVGHHAPGGGFIAGLVAGSAFVLVFLAGGAPQVRRSQPITAEALLGSGLTIASLAGVWGLAAGGDFLSQAKVSATLPVLGTLKLTSAFVFDLGVYLIVLGLVIAVLRSLGREEVRYA
jgi:multicomponent Na+:H+ antiporter subunit A